MQPLVADIQSIDLLDQICVQVYERGRAVAYGAVSQPGGRLHSNSFRAFEVSILEHPAVGASGVDLVVSREAGRRAEILVQPTLIVNSETYPGAVFHTDRYSVALTWGNLCPL
jgi:hypothetical protein